MFIASQLVNLLHQLSISDGYNIQIEESLEVFDDNDSNPDYVLDTVGEQEQKLEVSVLILDYMKKVVDYARPGTSFTRMQHAYPRVKDRKQLQRFREYVKKKGPVSTNFCISKIS